MADMVGIPRRLYSNVKIMWIMPQITLVLLTWFIGAILGLFAIAGMPQIVAGVPNTITIALTLLGFTGIVIVPSYIWTDFEYNAYTYQLTQHELVIRWGIINRHSVVVPYEKIQDVRTDRTWLERVLGLVTLKVETAGRSMVSTETAVIAGVASRERKDLISDIMANVVIRRGEFSHETHGNSYNGALLSVLTELRDISAGLKEEIGTLKHMIKRKK